jgi:hypothetical protein
MINRFNFLGTRSLFVDPTLRPRVNQPNMDQKTRADIRREILTKLSVRLRNLGIPNL